MHIPSVSVLLGTVCLAPLSAQQLHLPPSADIGRSAAVAAPATVTSPRTFQQILSAQLFAQEPQRFRSLEVAVSAQCGNCKVAWEVRLGYAGRSTRLAGPDLDANRRGAMQSVFSGDLTIDSSGSTRRVRIPFHSNFGYDPGKGDLLLEIRETKAALTAVVNPLVAYMPELLKTQRRGSGGSFAQAGARYGMWDAAVFLSPAGSSLELDAYVNHMNTKNGQTWFLVGAKTPLALDLGPFGAAGNQLYVDPLLVLPSTRRFMRCGGLHDHLSLPLPASAQLKGIQLSVTAVTADATANLLGLVFADALDLEFGDQRKSHGRLFMHDGSGTTAIGSGYSSLQLSFGLAEQN